MAEGSELTPYKAQFKQWSKTLEKAKPALIDVLPATIPPERLIRMALSQMESGSALLNCSPGSVLGVMLECAQLGLELSTGGQAYMVPFKKKGVPIATLIIGYQGFIDLAYRTGLMAVVQAEVVYENDEFEFHRQIGGSRAPWINHPKSEVEVSERGALRGAYLYACLKGSDQWIIHYLSRPEILEHKAHSRVGHVWKDHPAAMWKKTAVRDGQRWLPHDYTFGRAVTCDQNADLGKQDLAVDPRDFGISDDEAAEIVEAEIAETKE